MEYHLDTKNQIYADMAYRYGKIITQYENIILNEDKFEATLYVSVLQNLSVTINEHIREMTSSKRKKSIFKKNFKLSDWGIENAQWDNTFNEELTLQNFITRIRNSVSHPTKLDLRSKFPSTGFTANKDDSGNIKKFIFINSPDTTNNRPKLFNSLHDLEKVIYQRGQVEDKLIHSEFPKSIGYKKIETKKDIKYQLTLNDIPFARISKIELTVSELGEFVKILSNYLAQPIQEKWDGETIKDLFVA